MKPKLFVYLCDDIRQLWSLISSIDMEAYFIVYIHHIMNENHSKFESSASVFMLTDNVSSSLVATYKIKLDRGRDFFF